MAPGARCITWSCIPAVCTHEIVFRAVICQDFESDFVIIMAEASIEDDDLQDLESYTSDADSLCSMVPVQENSQVAAMGNGGMIQNCTDDHTQNTLLQVDIKPFTYNAVNHYSETSEQRTHWGQDSCPL